MHNNRLLALLVLSCTAVLAACGGGGSSSVPAQPGGASAGALQSVRVAMTIAGPPATTASGHLRGPKFVSPSTNGVQMSVYQPGTVWLVTRTTIDVSSGSPACGGAVGYPRTCTVTIAVAAGTYDFDALTYDAAPVGGGFPAGTKILGVAQSRQTVVLDASNTLSINLGGNVGSLTTSPYASLPADGATHTYAFVLQALDPDNNPIVAGPSDPYYQPISGHLIETGGSGHSTLVVNGAAVGAFASFSHSTDTIAIRYDGLGAPGYTTVTTWSTNSVTSSTQVSVTVSPLYLTSASPYFAANKLAFTGTGQSAPVIASETNAPAGTTYAATPNAGCSGVATAAVTGSTITVTAGTTAAAAGTCSIGISDGNGATVALGISNNLP
jgi:hypothetical protein